MTKRIIYKTGPIREKIVTQGTIINHCVADKYCCDVWGVVITPRCDLAHTGKVQHVHYLPVVPFEEWYKIDGVQYLWSRAHEKLRDKIRNICKKNGFPLTNLKEKQLRLLCDSINNQKEKDSFKSCIERYYSLEMTNPLDYVPNQSEKDALVKNMKEGSIHAFFLIEDWDNPEKYKVTLLRDLKRLEYNVVMGMATGLEEKAIVNAWRNDLSYAISKDTIYSTVAEIISPYIELLMERFSYNFCRIGVEDMDECVEDVLRKNI